MSIFILEIDTDIGTVGIVDGALELFDFLEVTEEHFHTLNKGVHLVKGTTIGQVGIGIKHYFIVAGEIAAVIDFIDEDIEAIGKACYQQDADSPTEAGKVAYCDFIEMGEENLEFSF